MQKLMHVSNLVLIKGLCYRHWLGFVAIFYNDE
jgi:hypothetical protein